MIHVLTVHWKTERWIDLQLRYLDRHVPKPFRVYAWLNEVPRHQREKFFYSTIEPVTSHAVKLNLLADIACAGRTSDDDVLLFIDGDAFPIADLGSYLSQRLEQHALVAVQRLENAGDPQPHPSFCATTVRCWTEIQGDWKAGYAWRRDRGGQDVTDVGGNLLGILQERGLSWHPMRRSNVRNPHPLWFGIYDDVVYHHGAGFRAPVCRADIEAHGGRFLHRPVDFARRLPKAGVLGAARRLLKRLYRRWRPLVPEAQVRESAALGEEIYERIRADPEFWRAFLEPDAVGSTDGSPAQRATVR